MVSVQSVVFCVDRFRALDFVQSRVVWVHHYADLLGYEPVPTIDDLYDDRLAALDLGFLVTGTAVIVAWDWLGLASVVGAVGGALVAAGCVAFVANVVLVLRRHSPQGLPEILFGPGVGGAVGFGADGSTANGSTADGSSATATQTGAERSTTPRDVDE